jgi:hypothetical protein
MVNDGADIRPNGTQYLTEAAFSPRPSTIPVAMCSEMMFRAQPAQGAGRGPIGIQVFT